MPLTVDTVDAAADTAGQADASTGPDGPSEEILFFDDFSSGNQSRWDTLDQTETGATFWSIDAPPTDPQGRSFHTKFAAGSTANTTPCGIGCAVVHLRKSLPTGGRPFRLTFRVYPISSGTPEIM